MGLPIEALKRMKQPGIEKPVTEAAVTEKRKAMLKQAASDILSFGGLLKTAEDPEEYIPEEEMLFEDETQPEAEALPEESSMDFATHLRQLRNSKARRPLPAFLRKA